MQAHGRKVTVYTGPTLSESSVVDFDAQHGTSTEVRPPVRHGDIFRSAPGAEDTLVIIDGLYHQRPAMKHKEYLHGIASGARIIGASSLGAIRGAELKRFGMETVGKVADWYCDGIIDSDADVAVAHGDAEQSWRPLTVPMVNIRYAVDCLGESIDPGGSKRIMQIAGEIFYAQRTPEVLLGAIAAELGTELASMIVTRSGVRPEFDIKNIDALLALGHAHFGCRGARSADTSAATLHASKWRTPLYFSWRNANFGDGTLVARVELQQLYRAKFPETWLHYLEYASLHPHDGTEGVDLEERIMSISPRLRRFDAPNLFRPAYCVSDAAVLQILLKSETDQQKALCHRAIENLANEIVPPSRLLRADLADGLLREIWKSNGSLENECRRRGFTCLDHARRALRRFVFHHLDIIQEFAE